MNTSFSKRTVAAMFLFVAMLAVPATAQTTQPSGPGGGQGQGGQMRGPLQRLRDAADKLQITDDQRAKIRQMVEDMVQQMRGLRDQGLSPDEMRTKAESMRNELRDKINQILSAEQQQ